MKVSEKELGGVVIRDDKHRQNTPDHHPAFPLVFDKYYVVPSKSVPAVLRMNLKETIIKGLDMLLHRPPTVKAILPAQPTLPFHDIQPLVLSVGFSLDEVGFAQWKEFLGSLPHGR